MSKTNKWMYMVGVCGLTLCTLSAAMPTGAMTGTTQQAQIVRAANVDDWQKVGNTLANTNPELTLTLHKYIKDGSETVYNDGENHDADVAGHTALDGITFTAVKVVPKEGKTNGTIDPAESSTYDTVGKTFEKTTGEDGTKGIAKFDFGKYNDAKGVYLIHEVPSSGISEPVADFLVQLPLTKADGSGFLTDVNVYPKNQMDTNKLNPMKTFTDGKKTHAIQQGQLVKWDLSVDVPETAYVEGADGTESYAKELYLLDPVSTHMTAKPDEVTAKFATVHEDKSVTYTDLQPGDFTVKQDTTTNVDSSKFKVYRFDLTKSGMKKAAGHKVIFTLPTTVDSFDLIDGKIAKPIVNSFDSHYTPNVGEDVPGTSDPDPKNPNPDPKDPNTPDPDPDPSNPDPDNPTVSFGRIDLTKVAEEDTTKTLEGAQFKIAYTKEQAEKGEFVEKIVDDKATGEDLILTTDKNGKASLNGLEKGHPYYLVETQAPKGYELSDQIYTVIAEADTTNDATVKDQIDVVQEYLPLTGGQLRLALMATGSVMILAFGTALYIKKRREA